MIQTEPESVVFFSFIGKIKHLFLIYNLVYEEIGQQKRHLLQDAFLNGGAAIFDGVRVLRTPGGDVQFPV